ncbi:hypothetical protein CCACVL1_06180, partial [Corchorus capsularis]
GKFQEAFNVGRGDKKGIEDIVVGIVLNASKVRDGCRV